MTIPQSASLATPRSTRTRRVVALCAALLCAVFFALGAWQLQRLQWKTALIAQVDQRAHAAPAAAPSSSAWANLSSHTDDYRHLRLEGRFLDHLSTQVQAVTELGAGHWVLTPFIGSSGGNAGSDSGAVVLVNRGFIPNGAVPADAGPDPVSITGLLRMSEPAGGFLRDNDARHNRWYSRDVAAIGAARGLSHVAPWFLDQDAAVFLASKTGSDPSRSNPVQRQVRGADSVAINGTDPGSDLGSAPILNTPVFRPGALLAPVGGLTVISFRNSHLVYALTWFAMGLMAAGAAYAIARGKI